MKKILKIFLLLGVILMVSPAANAQVSVGVSVRIAPPPLPVYVQPECPVDGWLWQPGYWAYDPIDGYYWVPGVWVAPPEPGLLWTPCYWGFDDGIYVFHRGYWAHNVGFYGGINYGYGYPGYGFYGGMWSGRVFRYNTAVFRVNRTVVRNVYVNRENFRPTASRASFNGRGGIMASPRPEDRRAMNERHFQPTNTQISHQQSAGRNPAQRFSANQGRPSMAAMNRPERHSISSPAQMGNRPSVSRGNPAQNQNRGFDQNRGQNRSQTENHNYNGFNRSAPQVDRSNPAHRDMNRAQQMAPQRAPQRLEQRSMQQRQYQQQRMQRQEMPQQQRQFQQRVERQNWPQQQRTEQPRQMPQQQRMMEPQRMPQPQRMGGGGFGGGQPRQGGGGEQHGGRGHGDG